MGYLRQIESLATGAVQLIQKPVQATGEFGWTHRNATFVIANTNFGSSPFGNNPAPFATRKWPWKVGVYGFLSGDAAHDALASAIGVAMPQRLVYHHDAGYERVNNGVAYTVGEPYKVEGDYYREYNVEWELNSPWTERNPVDPRLRSGQGLRCGQVIGGLVSRSGEGGSTYALSASPMNVSTGIADSSVPGAGGVATYPDFCPIITITGPFGGSLGLRIQNLSDPYQPFFNYTTNGGVPAGWIVVFDCGAKSALAHQPGQTTTTNVRQYVSPPYSQAYWSSVWHGLANQFVVTALVQPGETPVTGGSINISWRRYFV